MTTTSKRNSPPIIRDHDHLFGSRLCSVAADQPADLIMRLLMRTYCMGHAGNSGLTHGQRGMHKGLVFAELVGTGVLLWTTATHGIANETLFCWVLMVLLMLFSKTLQVYWRLHDEQNRALPLGTASLNFAPSGS